MNNNLFFLILSTCLLVLSVITICLAPIMNGAGGNYFEDWNIANCQKMDDDYKYAKGHDAYNLEYKEEYVRDKIDKRRITECKRHKIMYSFEYVAFYVDVVLSFICFVLGLIHYLESGNNFEKVSGIIGLISGIIVAALTIVYVAFSTLIFSNEAIKNLEILYPNKAYARWNGQKYIHDYDEEKARSEDSDLKLAKFKDLGKKQYNYDSELYKMNADGSNGNEFKNCQAYLNLNDYSIQRTYDINGNTHNCEYIWNPNYNRLNQESTDNKFLYDRWLTTIIFGLLITICGICLVLFGFLLFKNSGDSKSGPIPEL